VGAKMPKTKKIEIPKETTFQHIARWERNISSVAIFIFMICYVLGKFFRFGQSTIGYLKVAAVNAVLLTIICAIIFFLHQKKSGVNVGRLILFFAVFFIAAYAEYYIINHQKLYWIILAVLIAALSLSVLEFWIQLKSIWFGTVQSREKTLIQFIYLYATTVFSFAFMYTILGLNRELFFYNAYPSDPFFDYLYLSIITVSTLGYGDIIPQTALAKFLVMIQTIVGYLFLYIFLGLVVSWLGTREK
jgi:hypothetical protein